jgi:hypothetical protein
VFVRPREWSRRWGAAGIGSAWAGRPVAGGPPGAQPGFGGGHVVGGVSVAGAGLLEQVVDGGVVGRQRGHERFFPSGCSGQRSLSRVAKRRRPVRSWERTVASSSPITSADRRVAGRRPEGGRLGPQQGPSARWTTSPPPARKTPKAAGTPCRRDRRAHAVRPIRVRTAIAAVTRCQAPAPEWIPHPTCPAGDCSFHRHGHCTYPAQARSVAPAEATAASRLSRPARSGTGRSATTLRARPPGVRSRCGRDPLQRRPVGAGLARGWVRMERRPHRGRTLRLRG